MAQHRRASVDARRSRSMSPRPDLGPKPRLGYAASSIERAAERRADAAALAALESDPRARAYVVAGELVVSRRPPLLPIRCSHWQKRAHSAARRNWIFSASARTRRALRSH